MINLCTACKVFVRGGGSDEYQEQKGQIWPIKTKTGQVGSIIYDGF